MSKKCRVYDRQVWVRLDVGLWNQLYDLAMYINDSYSGEIGFKVDVTKIIRCWIRRAFNVQRRQTIGRLKAELREDEEIRKAMLARICIDTPEGKKYLSPEEAEKIKEAFKVLEAYGMKPMVRGGAGPHQLSLEEAGG